MTHRFGLRVYYEDTDLAGVVYYANYLKFIERARTEYIRELGIDQRVLKATEGMVFAVRRVEADYMAPAHFDDQLSVVTTPVSIGGASITLQQDVERDGVVLFKSVVTLVAVGPQGKPTRLPAAIRRKLA